jgi:hypothetical protein
VSEVQPARSVVSSGDPALWVVLTLLVAGAVRFTLIAVRFASTYPVATLTAVVLFALLAVPFWLFVSELDFLEREPIGLRVIAVAWGGLVATTVSIPGSAALEDVIAKVGSPHLAADWGAALAGAGVGYLVVRTDRSRARRLGVAALALFGAWASHVLWNSPILTDGLGNGGLALFAVLVLKGLPPLVLILLLVRSAHDREAGYYVGKLAELHDPELITEAELAVLGSGARRAAARRQAGRPARATVRRLQRAQARLAVELSRAPSPAEDESVRRRCADVREQRRVLVGLGHPEAAASPVSWQHTASTAVSVAVGIAVLWVSLSALGGA